MLKFYKHCVYQQNLWPADYITTILTPREIVSPCMYPNNHSFANNHTYKYPIGFPN